ncbi:MAG: 1-acyl-sn-glycerol-3-phosphate acyltransferase [Deltaproteobacteria bacterium]|nr:1-acyl-sn-glycerol-3-phosphate acyltransferase [Deltaproteobacteria bacterium]
MATLAMFSYPLFGAAGVDFFSRWWARITLLVGDVHVAVRGAEKIDRTQSYVYVCNHQSGLDILIALGWLPQCAHFVAKRELARVPFMGWAMSLSGHIFVDRARGTQAIAALRAAASGVRGGKSVIVFPEGTRFPPRTVGPFKAGAFVLARAAQVPIVPVGIVGSAERMQARRFYTTPGVVGMRIGDPIPPEQFEDEDAALAERVRHVVAGLAGPSGSHLTQVPHRKRAAVDGQPPPDDPPPVERRPADDAGAPA